MTGKSAIFATALISFLMLGWAGNAQPVDPYQPGNQPPLSWEMYRQQQIELQIEMQRQQLDLRRRQLELQHQQLEIQRQQLELERQRQQLELEKQRMERDKR